MNMYPQYTNGYYNLPLPGGYPPVYWYPPYGPPAGYAPPAPHRSPRHRRRDITPSPPLEVIAHMILSPSANLRWAVMHDPADGGQYFPTANSNPTRIPNHILTQAATSPPLSRMQLVCDDFPWAITITPPSGPVTVRHVLGAIYEALRENLLRGEWDEMRGNERKNAHRARCARVSKGQATFAIGHETGAIRRVDTLGDRVVFLGLKPRGPRDDPVEWVVRLGPP